MSPQDHRPCPPIHRKGTARKARFAFTLLELMVVMTAIACVIALVMPTLRVLTATGLNAKCVTNLKSISAGLHGYIADHGGDFPPCAQLPSSGYKIRYRPNTFWFDALNPYMGQPAYAPDRVAAFPAASAVGTEFPFAWQLCPAKKITPLQRQTIGYGWNRSNFGYTLTTGESSGFGARIAEIKQPSKTIVIADSEGQEDNFFQHRYIYDYDFEKRYPYPTRHAGAGNYLFVDGHIEALTPAFVKSVEGRKLFKRK